MPLEFWENFLAYWKQISLAEDSVHEACLIPDAFSFELAKF